MIHIKKKIILSTISGTAVLLISAQVFAVSVLNTNVINLIKESINNLKSYYTAEASQGVEDVNTAVKQDIQNYTIQKGTDARSELDQHVNSELQRAEDEISSYSESLKREADAVINENVKLSKGEITKTVDSEINNAKQDIEKEFEKQIKESLKH